MGSHTCLYYESEENLLELVSSFFEQGFRTNKLCLWVVPQSLGVKGAKAALSKKIKDLDIYIEKDQLELLSHEDVYLKSGIFNADDTLALFAKKWQDVLKQGFSGLCVSGDASWLEKKDWDKITTYEKEVDKLIPQREITALCTYPAEKFDMVNLFSLSFSHDLIIRKNNDKTDILMDRRDIFK
ncbi:MAG: MEDS domain-containing protein [Candidatus Omnitrophota bacterium]|jgi:hypothetical protein